MKINVLGFPRIGHKRELKFAIESYWKGEKNLDDLLKVAQDIRVQNWNIQKQHGVDLIPSNDFSLYDGLLDTACMLGNIPQRFGHKSHLPIDIDLMFTAARGKPPVGVNYSEDLAMEMTKWFDTNYHMIVPEISEQTNFYLGSTKAVDEFKEALALGIKTKPVLIGPLTYIYLSKSEVEKTQQQVSSWLEKMMPVYNSVLADLNNLGADYIQIDEPILSLDLNDNFLSNFEQTYQQIRLAACTSKIILTNYFGTIGTNSSLLTKLPIDIYHLDACHGSEELEKVLKTLPKHCGLSLGIVNGRNIWLNNYQASIETIQKSCQFVDPTRIMLATSCSLLHAPVSLSMEENLPADIKPWLSFATEKLQELNQIQSIFTHSNVPLMEQNQEIFKNRKNYQKTTKPDMQKRIQEIPPSAYQRKSNYSMRHKVQKECLNLPLFPTTSIGSLPQTTEIRKARAQFKKGTLSELEYRDFIAKEIDQALQFQEEIGIDVLVHGEFERNDMVEFFGENLEGFLFTKFGWVQSYGSRCVKPPIIYGDIERTKPMTLGWTNYAQKKTKKPVKGMLTGPVTILQWSFVRDDQPRQLTAYNIALAIRDEVADLEKNNIQFIQIDEPAFREGLPLRKNAQKEYLEWAINAFKLASSGVKDETQIHTHMCYSDFNQIIDSIAALDADVISIESVRSDSELLNAFSMFDYPNEIGPGVYDIHSPRVANVDEIKNHLAQIIKSLPVEKIWVNPDCGLKTRHWSEVKPSLMNMVAAAKKMRENYTASK